MTTRVKRHSPAEHLEQRIGELDGEVERVRAEFGDPAAALGTFLRAWIGLDALEATYAEYLRHEDPFLFDDYDDRPGAGEDEDGRERR